MPSLSNASMIRRLTSSSSFVDSKTVTLCPDRVVDRAVARPLRPAPTTMTSNLNGDFSCLASPLTDPGSCEAEAEVAKSPFAAMTC